MHYFYRYNNMTLGGIKKIEKILQVIYKYTCLLRKQINLKASLKIEKFHEIFICEKKDNLTFCMK